MAWNSPDNFGFSLALLCTERKRQNKFWVEHAIQQGQLWEDNFVPHFSSPIQDDFDPNCSIEVYGQEWYSSLVQQGYVGGPLWRFVPGGGFLFADSGDYFGTPVPSLLDNLKPVVKWSVIPTWDDVVAAFTAQVFQQESSIYPSLDGSFFYRPEWVETALFRNKELWKFENVQNPPDRLAFYVGRVQPDQSQFTASGDYITAFFSIEPYGTNGLLCRKLSCKGCCCCC